MNREEAKQRIGQLTEEINLHNYNYYDLSMPTITDYEFDRLLEELILLLHRIVSVAGSQRSSGR
jgi:DNA ligase (NAD+)